MTKEEYLNSIKTTEAKLESEGKELIKFDDGDPESSGWEVRYIDREEVEIILGCKCSDTGSVHDKL